MYIQLLQSTLYIQLQITDISLQRCRQVVVSDIAALNFMYHVEQQACGIVKEPVAIHAAVLLTVEVYSVFETRCQPGADGLRVIVPTVHGYDA